MFFQDFLSPLHAGLDDGRVYIIELKINLGEQVPQRIQLSQLFLNWSFLNFVVNFNVLHNLLVLLQQYVADHL